MHSSFQGVRKVSLGSLNAAAQHKPQLIREHLGTLLPLLYGETEVKKELIRVVQMGPWKQTFDDGLETRSASHTLLSETVAALTFVLVRVRRDRFRGLLRSLASLFRPVLLLTLFFSSLTDHVHFGVLLV